MDVRDWVRENGLSDNVEPSDAGFALVRRPQDDPGRFSRAVSRMIERAGGDYVALPRTDGQTGYDGVFIILLDDAPSRPVV